MASCKECIHEKACRKMLEAMGYKVAKEYKGNADRCNTFKSTADVVETANLTPCDLCAYNPPSSGDGKPCCMCPATRKPQIEE